MPSPSRNPSTGPHDIPPRLLLVDSHPGGRARLVDFFSRQGFTVETAADGNGLRDHIEEGKPPDIVVLDPQLPDADGLELLRSIRTFSDVPLIMISALDDEQKRIQSLVHGADDYVRRPCNRQELLARVQAILRRYRPIGRIATAAPAFGPFQLDIAGGQLRRNGITIPLTADELDLLHAFLRHPNQLLHRERLLDLLKGHGRMPFDRSIDVLVARLRAKIEDNRKHPRYILTVWGKGYRFTPHRQIH